MCCVVLLAAGLLGYALGAPAAHADPVVAAAGDIACGSNSASSACHQLQTSNILLGMSQLAAVLPLGDNQYECGELSNFQNFYDPTWGRLKSITHPVVGNHEYLVSNDCLPQGPGAPGYFTYFGWAIASPLDPGCTSNCRGYYSYDLGTWHLVALNSNCPGGCQAGSAQYNWLKADLAATRQNCILAYFHHPRYSSGGRQTNVVQALWEALYDAGADVVLTGHDHDYERFAKLGRGTSAATDPVADPNGIREWVVGTGGRNFTPFVTTRSQSQVRENSVFGVLQLTLHFNSYDWQFLPEAGATFTDSGSDTCNGAPAAPPTVPSGLTATAVSAKEIDLRWNPSTATLGVAGYHVFRGGALVATVTSGTNYKDRSLRSRTRYSYTVSAFDTANQESAQSSPVAARTRAPRWPQISGHALTLRADGTVRIALTCPASHGKRCKGMLRLTAGRHTLARKRFSVRRRHAARVTVRLRRSGQRLARHAHRLTVKVTAGSNSRNLLLRA